MFRQDPGLCPICGAAHSACRTGTGAILIVQLPQRDAMLTEAQSAEVPAELVPPVVENEVEPFTTGSYTRAKHGLRRTPR